MKKFQIKKIGILLIKTISRLRPKWAPLEMTLNLFIVFVCFSNVLAETNTNQPHIGYLYPAGGQAGKTVEIIAGGQFLGGSDTVYITGNGVHASVVEHFRNNTNINQDERQEIVRRMTAVWDKRMAELKIQNPPPLFPQARFQKPQTTDPNKAKSNDPNKEKARNFNHVLLYDLENKSISELISIREILFIPREKRQQNRQLGEAVVIRITIDANAEPGNRELRIVTRQGITTNPIMFQVGVLPEINSLKSGNKKLMQRFPELAEIIKEKPLELPVLINGQILPGDIDKIHFRGKAGEKLVIQTQARILNPYLADAVPGWFQAETSLYDANGKELAFEDDYRFNPDPVMFYKIPKNGEYELAIHDSLYRGREDFVYRVSIGQLPFVTQMFPLGGSEGVRTLASIEGWNLDKNKLLLDTSAGEEKIRQTCCRNLKMPSNIIPYSVDNLPECNEIETKNSQQINLPIIINGQILTHGDIDTFGFKGKAGEKIVAEVYARRLNSPLDSLLRLTDESGKVLKFNDDFSIMGENYLYKNEEGLLTHHADSYLCAQLPADSNYFINISDAENHGGKAYGYRLRISEPKPDFAVRMSPSTLNIRAGSNAAFNVYVLREDGFDGQIKIALKDEKDNFVIAGGVIPANQNSIQMTIAAKDNAFTSPINLHLISSAEIDGKTIVHPVAPCEDMMQAFLYRHLVPSQELFAAPLNIKRPVPPITPDGNFPLKISPGQTAKLICKKNNIPFYERMKFELSNPPKGLTLADVNVMPEKLIFTLKADKDIKPGLKDNLIVEISTDAPAQQKTKQKNAQQTVSLGVLQAIPIIIE